MGNFDEKLSVAERRIDFAMRGGQLIENGADLVSAHRLLQQAKELLSEARDEADKIRALAETRAHELTARALAQGHAQGVAQFAGILEETHAHRDALLKQTEGDVVELALHIADKIVRGALDAQPELYRNQILDLVQSLDSPQSEVHVCAAQLDLFAPLESRGIKVVPHAGLSPFETRVLTPAHSLKTGVSHRVAEIRRDLLTDET